MLDIALLQLNAVMVDLDLQGIPHSHSCPTVCESAVENVSPCRSENSGR